MQVREDDAWMKSTAVVNKEERELLFKVVAKMPLLSKLDLTVATPVESSVFVFKLILQICCKLTELAVPLKKSKFVKRELDCYKTGYLFFDVNIGFL